MAERRTYPTQPGHRYFPDVAEVIDSPTLVPGAMENPILVTDRVRQIRASERVVTGIKMTAEGVLIYSKPEVERTDFPGRDKPTAIFESPR